MRTKILFFAIAVVCSVLAAPRVDAEGVPCWSDNGVVICNAAGGQADPQLVGDGSGGAIITWQDSRGGSSDIYAQCVDAGGSPQWASNGVVICHAADGQSDPQLVGDGSGGAIITWEDNRSGNLDIYAQRVDAGGNPQWASNGVRICDAADGQCDPQLVGDGSGGAIITWEDLRSGTSDIYAQRIDVGGSIQWTWNGVIICDTTAGQYDPQLVGDGSGGAIITWMDRRGGVCYDIYAQRVDAGGSPLWASNGVVICDATDEQSSPQLVGDGSGGAIITWCDYRSGNLDIYAQCVDAGGSPQWTSNGVVICDATDGQSDPQLVGDGTGGAIITWQDSRGGGNYDIYAQHVDAGGSTQWASNGLVICDATGTQDFPRLVENGSGGAIITWEDSRGGGNYDIYAQHVDAGGSTQWASNGVVICDATDWQRDPQLLGDESGGAIIAWEDNRSGNYDIYAQQVLDPAPSISAITDVPEDQGRQVAVMWHRSAVDQHYYQMITEYSIWRKYPYGSKIELFGQEWVGSTPKDLSRPVFRKIDRKGRRGDLKTEYWEYIGSVAAHYFEGYAYIAPTLEDSSASGIPYFTFLVSAQTAEPFVFWDSLPDSGYSVDDIDPAKTQIGILTSGSAKGSVNTIWLSWDQVTAGEDGSPERGPIDYRVYCDERSDFVPDPGNLLTTVSGLSYVHNDVRIGDPIANLFYVVTAIDGSDNESAVSNVVGEFDRSLCKVK